MHAHQNTGWKLQWQDEFNYADVPDSNKWSYDVGGDGWWNKELQYYTNKRKENARVENGQLIIEARKEDFEENKYTSARLVTKGKADFKYGKIELRAKLPKGRGIWPAFWLLSSQDPRIWPDDGEIDIMEHVGYKQGEITGATHVKKNANGTDILSKASTIMIPDAAENFHTYTLIWSPEKLEWYVDHKLFHHFDKDNRPSYQWPFDKEFYILLNIAIGGTWGGKEGIDDTIFPQKIHLDYVRVYKKVNKY
jgi:beta-glucanase (GH16 family)